MYYNNVTEIWLRSSTISLDGYGSKIRKVSRCRPTVSNGTILATKQESFFTKVAPVQSITAIVLLGFLLILLPFVSFNTTIYVFVKNSFSKCLYISEYDIRILFVFWLRNRPSKMYTGAYRGRGVSRLMCTYALTLFNVLCIDARTVLWFLVLFVEI